VSEYQYYKLERLDGYLDAKARQALRAISSRAEISATSFQVYYTYSDLKAEPFELMLKYLADADSECNTLTGWLMGFHGTWSSARSSLLSDI